jgi:hypothetical protein
VVVGQVADEDDLAFKLERARQIREGVFRVPRNPTFIVAISSRLDQVDSVRILLNGVAVIEDANLW